jgi:putative transposase
MFRLYERLEIEENSSFHNSCEVRTVPLEPKMEAIAVDVGIESFATLSNGKKIANPRFFKKGEKALAKVQRKLNKLQNGTKERRKTGKAVAKIHERIKNQRKDFCYKQSRKIVDQYQYICIEDLNVKNMIKESHFEKSIADVSWNQFRQFLTYKAAEAGRKLGLVNPAYTSQVCSQCGHLEPKKLAEREHKCSQCGYTAHRDFNAAQNILALGLDGLREILRSFRL